MYVQIGKWHQVRLQRGGLLITRCGQTTGNIGAQRVDIPSGGDQCGACLRLIVRNEENGR